MRGTRQGTSVEVGLCYILLCGGLAGLWRTLRKVQVYCAKRTFPRRWRQRQTELETVVKQQVPGLERHASLYQNDFVKVRLCTTWVLSLGQFGFSLRKDHRNELEMLQVESPEL